MAALQQSIVEMAGTDMRIDATPKTSEVVGPVDFWGHAVPCHETEDEEISRMLLPINWLCSLLEGMDRTPSEADRHRAECKELMDRLLASGQSPHLRDALIDASVWMAARRYRSAAETLRAIAA